MMPGGSQTFTNDTYSSQKIQQVGSDGSAEMLRTIDSTISIMNGQPFRNPRTQGAIGFPLKVRVASTGKVMAVQSIKDSLDEAAKAVFEALRSQLMSQPSFPARPVGINDSWQDSTKITQQTQMGPLNTVIRYSTTLTGVDTVSGIKVWALKMNISLAGGIEGGSGAVQGSGSGYVYFSTDLGKEIRSTLNIDQTMDINSPQGSMTMTMKTTTTRELIQ